MQQPRLAAFLQLLPDITYVDSDDVVVLRFIRPHRGKQLLTRQDITPAQGRMGTSSRNRGSDLVKLESLTVSVKAPPPSRARASRANENPVIRRRLADGKPIELCN